MTLVQSISASWSLARRSAALACWPDGTVHSATDVIIDRSSLMDAAFAAPTPLVRIGAAGGWAPSSRTPQRFVTVLLTRVEQVDLTYGNRRLAIRVDACLERCRPNFDAARLLGRHTSARRRKVSVHSVTSAEIGYGRLPVDIVVGDLLALPCDGALPLSYARHPAFSTDETFSTDESDQERRLRPGDEDPGLPSCLK
ncbi:hypothetical protein [Mycetocola zhujimingii]|uniref:hypothetical protein n=1 Tax=Mycetocola zhujimingii TaxID=2079792 RepID=UPI000D3974DC|nr:hypothetical protein [Mycetocola zhujimingii]AWB85642.1 hypothetical protein C3E77_02710 [Mycetocola zhujimingii]